MTKLSSHYEKVRDIGVLPSSDRKIGIDFSVDPASTGIRVSLQLAEYPPYACQEAFLLRRIGKERSRDQMQNRPLNRENARRSLRIRTFKRERFLSN